MMSKKLIIQSASLHGTIENKLFEVQTDNTLKLIKDTQNSEK